MNVVDDEMVIDTSAFTFADIIDDDDIYVEEPAKVADEEIDEFEESEDEELFDEDEDGEESELSDEGIDEIKKVSEAVDLLNHMDDGFEINLGEEKITKGELMGIIRGRKEIAEREQQTRNYIDNFTKREEEIKVVLSSAKTETEIQLEKVNAFLNDPSQWSDMNVVREVAQTKTVLESRIAELKTKEEAVKQSLIEGRQQAAAVRFVETARGIGGKEKLEEVIKHAQTLGIEPSLILDGLNPAIAEALLNDKAYRALKQKNAERIKATDKGAPKSVSARTSGKKVPVKKDTAEAIGLKKRIAEGKLRPGDLDRMYDHLVD